jgi:hypothetical protein
MIKNWVVKTKQIKKGSKGLKNYVYYLQNDKAVSHSKTIFDKPIGSGSKLFDAYDLRRYERQKKGLRGGGVSNHATSFVISCPPNVHPSSKQWKKVAKDVMKELADHLGVKPKTLAKHSFLNVHDESKSGKHSHLNVVCSNIIDNEVRKDLTQHKATWCVKHSVNAAFKKHLGIDHKTYVARDSWKIGKNKPLWAARLLNTVKTDLDQIVESQNSLREKDFSKSVDVAMARLSDYFESLKKPSLLSRFFGNSDKRKTKIEYQKELLIDSLSDLDDDRLIDKIVDETEQIETDFDVCTADQLKQSRDRIDADREKKRKAKEKKAEEERVKKAEKAIQKQQEKQKKNRKKDQDRKGRNTKRRTRNNKKQP